jgi:UDP-glucuronate 4-epimerase
MRILITGATSFAARELLPTLLEHGHVITAISRQQIEGVDSHIVDFSEDGADRKLPDKNYDVLIHFASTVPRIELESTWAECSPMNIYGTIRLLKWAEKRAGRIILASSTSIYGARPVKQKISETNLLFPITNYALTKYGQEQIVNAFCISRNIPFVIMRLGYVYGPGILNDRVVIKFIHAVKTATPIILRNAKTTGLPLIHTKDIAHIVLEMLSNGYGVYNVIGQEFISLFDYVTTVMQVTGQETEVKEKNSTINLRTDWYSNKKLRSDIIHPKVSLEDGVRDLLTVVP